MLTKASSSNRGVWVSLYVCVAQTCALAAAAWLTGSSALITQTATGLADVAGGIFLLIGVISSSRAADVQHPLGYGRERFFWSFLAAVGVFFGGFGVAMAETVRAAVHPELPGLYAVGYAVLAVNVALDGIALNAGLRPLLARAVERHLSIRQMLWRGTDPAATTVVLTSATGVLGGLLAIAGLALAQLTDRTMPDTVASALIGLVLLATSVVLLHTNRELLTGRGLPVSEIHMMREILSKQTGVQAVPDIFAVVIGPGTVIVDGDVVFQDDLDVPAVEASIVSAASALRRSWPAVAYVYLNPVAQSRPRRSTGDGPQQSLSPPAGSALFDVSASGPEPSHRPLYSTVEDEKTLNNVLPVSTDE